MKTEYKTIETALKQVGDDGTFEAVIATFGKVDKDGDIVEHGAFGDATVPVLPSHDSQHVPLGKVRIEERGELAIAVGGFNMEIESARDWRAALKFDLDHPPPVQQWSWGFRTNETSEDTVSGETVRRLIELDMIEVSPVLRGSSVGTVTLFAKSEDAHESETCDDLWDILVYERRLTAEAKDSGAYALVGSDGKGHFLHHMIDEKGKTGAANVRACLAGIAALKGVRGVSTLPEKQRLGVYEHLASHLKSAGFLPSNLGDKPGIGLVDQLKLVTWDAESVLARIAAATGDRKLGKEAKSAALEMAEQHGELMKQLRTMVEKTLPEDASVRAAARFLASESASHL